MKKRFLCTLLVVMLSFSICSCSNKSTETISTVEPTEAETPTPTAIHTPTAEPTATPEPVEMETPMPEVTSEPTETEILEPTEEPTPTETATPEPTAMPEVTVTPEPVVTVEPTPEPITEPTPATDTASPSSTELGVLANYSTNEWIDMGDWFLYIYQTDGDIDLCHVYHTEHSFWKDKVAILQERYPDEENIGWALGFFFKPLNRSVWFVYAGDPQTMADFYNGLPMQYNER